MAYPCLLNVHLTPELERLLREEVASGRYASAREVVREGLRHLLEERRWRAEVREKIAEGLAQARAGQLLDGDEVFERLLSRIDSGPSKTG